MSDNDPVAAFRIEAGELLESVERALLDGHFPPTSFAQSRSSS